MPSMHDISINITARAQQLDATLRQTQQSTAQLTNTVRTLNTQFGQTRGATQQGITGLAALGSSLVGLAAGYVTVQAAAQGAAAVFRAGQTLEVQARAWKALAGSVAEGNKEIAFVRATADRVGVSFESLEKGYRNITAAAKGTALEGQATRSIFLTIAEAGSVLGLSSDDVAGSLRTIAQMMSTGTVQADELKNELGNRLPGAVALAAKAMDLGTKEFVKLQEQGKILTDEFLPKFDRAIRERFLSGLGEATTATRTSGQSLAELGNAVTRLAGIVAEDSGMLTWTKNVAKWVAEALQSLIKIREEVEKVDAITKKTRTAAATAAVTDRMGPLPLSAEDREKARAQVEVFDQQIAQVQEKLLTLRQQFAGAPFPNAPDWIRRGFQIPFEHIEREEARLRELVTQRKKFLESLAPTMPTLNDPEASFQTPGSTAAFEKQFANSKKLLQIGHEVDTIFKDLGKVRPDFDTAQTPLGLVEAQLKFVNKELETLGKNFSEIMEIAPDDLGNLQVFMNNPGNVAIDSMEADQMRTAGEAVFRVIRLRDELQQKKNAAEGIGDLSDLRTSVLAEQTVEIAKLVEQLRTGVTDADIQRWEQLWDTISEQEAADDIAGMTQTLAAMDEQLKLNTSALTERERAQVLAKIETLGANGALLEHAKALAADSATLELYTKKIAAWKTLAEAMTEVERSLQGLEEQRHATIADIIDTMKDGFPTLKAWEEAQKRLRELGADDATLVVGKQLREKSTDEFRAIRDAAESTAATIEDTLIASLTEGSKAWKDLGKVAIQELARILLNASGFRAQLTTLLQEGMTALTRILQGLGGGAAGASSLSLNPSTDIGGSLPLQQGGPVASRQRAQVGEAGYELLVTRHGAALVGMMGPEVIRPTEPGFVLPHRVTKQLLQRTQINPHVGVAFHAQRALGGPVMPGMAYLVGEGGNSGQGRGGGSGRGEATIHVTMHINGVQNPREFRRSEAEMKRAMALVLRDAQRNI